MTTITGIANEMAKRFIYAENKKYAINIIMHDLNYLVYSNNKQPLDYKTKSNLFIYILDVIAGREKLLLKEGEEASPDFSDIVYFFERRDFILKHLKAGIEKQCELN
jgi:hypothetical protein